MYIICFISVMFCIALFIGCVQIKNEKYWQGYADGQSDCKKNIDNSPYPHDGWDGTDNA